MSDYPNNLVLLCVDIFPYRIYRRCSHSGTRLSINTPIYIQVEMDAILEAHVTKNFNKLIIECERWIQMSSPVSLFWYIPYTSLLSISSIRSTFKGQAHTKIKRRIE